MSGEHTQVDAIRIREDQDAERQVVIHPEDNDLFVQTGRQVIDACRLNISIDLWMKELTSAFQMVAAWLSDRAPRVRACYFESKGAKMSLFFVPASDHFDFDLADELTDLNGRLISEFNIGMVELYQVPEKETDRFLSEAARLIYGHRERPHSTVAT